MSIVPNAICIPRIEATIPKSTIQMTFNKLNIGAIDGVVEIPFKDAPRYKRIIVKINWNDSDRAKYILSRFQEGKNVKIVYNSPSPWFWICVPNRLHCKVFHPANESSHYHPHPPHVAHSSSPNLVSLTSNIHAPPGLIC
jgi:hypothetical protein